MNGFRAAIFSSHCVWLAAFGAAESPKPPVVFVETVRAAELSDELMYPARLVSKINAAVLAETDGVVHAISAPLGQRVKKNQKLLVIANTDPVYRYAPMIVKAPVAGVVSSVDVTEGSRVNRGQRLATITDPKQIHLQIEVALSDLPSLSPGMEGQLTVSSQRETISVRITGVSPFVDPGTGTASAELEIRDPKRRLHLIPGLVGRVSLQAKKHRGIEIPEHALVYKGKATHVRLVEAGVAYLKPVSIGETRRGAVEILKGIPEGASLVVRANGYVADGEKVTVQSSDQAGGG